MRSIDPSDMRARLIHDSTQFPLLQLPLELRNMIYEHVLGEYLIASKVIWVGKMHENLDYVGYRLVKLLQTPNELRAASRVSDMTLPQLDANICRLALVCRQVAQETAFLRYKLNIFCFDPYTLPGSMLLRQPRKVRSLITKLAFDDCVLMTTLKRKRIDFERLVPYIDAFTSLKSIYFWLDMTPYWWSETTKRTYEEERRELLVDWADLFRDRGDQRYIGLELALLKGYDEDPTTASGPLRAIV